MCSLCQDLSKWYHVMTLTVTFGLLQGQICCRAGDHNSLNLLVLTFVVPLYPGLPMSYEDADWKPPQDPPCIIQLLCQKHEGLEMEAKTIKEHWWKPHVKKLFDKKVGMDSLLLFSVCMRSLRSADNVGRPFCCCVVFSFLFIFLFFLLFLSHYLRSAISLPFFIGSLSYLASW